MTRGKRNRSVAGLLVITEARIAGLPANKKASAGTCPSARRQQWMDETTASILKDAISG